MVLLGIIAASGSTIGAVPLEPLSMLEFLLEVDYWGWFKTILFYLMLAICAAQTFYPILMIIAMFIRQLGFLAQYFHEVSSPSDTCRLPLVIVVFMLR